VLTGRYAPPEIIQQADVVSEILEIKHPYQKGVLSRKGIDW
jgi:cob(I)alamin adenosyltransferase